MFYKVVKKAIVLSVVATLAVTPVVASAAGATTVGYGSYGSSGSSETTTEETTTETVVETVTEPTVVLPNGVVIKSSVAGSNSAESVKGIALTLPKAEVNAALGVQSGERAYVKIADSNYGPAAQSCVKAAAASLGAGVEAVLDINMGKITANGAFQTVKNANGLVEFKMVPKGQLKAGYEWAVVRVQVGAVVTVLPNWSDDPSHLRFFTDGSGVFALVQVPAGSVDNAKIAQYQQANS